MRNGIRMIDGREFLLAGREWDWDAKETAKRYRAKGLIVRLIAPFAGSAERLIWIHGDPRLI